MKQRTGYLFKDKKTKKWVARVTYTDEAGKRRNVKRYCETKTEARTKLDELKRQLDNRSEQAIDSDKMKFREVAERYEKAKLIEPVYVGEKKVAGMRSTYVPKLYLKLLVEYFGNKRVRSITHRHRSLQARQAQDAYPARREGRRTRNRTHSNGDQSGVGKAADGAQLREASGLD